MQTQMQIQTQTQTQQNQAREANKKMTTRRLRPPPARYRRQHLSIIILNFH